MVDRIALCAAGLEAERVFGCEATHEHAGWSDFAKILEILDDLPDEKADDLRFSGHDRAFEILNQRRSLIERLAEPLVMKWSVGREGSLVPAFAPLNARDSPAPPRRGRAGAVFRKFENLPVLTVARFLRVYSAQVRII